MSKIKFESEEELELKLLDIIKTNYCTPVQQKEFHNDDWIYLDASELVSKLGVEMEEFLYDLKNELDSEIDHNNNRFSDRTEWKTIVSEIYKELKD